LIDNPGRPAAIMALKRSELPSFLLRLLTAGFGPVTAAPVIHHRVGYQGSFCRIRSLQVRRFVTDGVEKGLAIFGEQ
jgi:hypothetical protein